MTNPISEKQGSLKPELSRVVPFMVIHVVGTTSFLFEFIAPEEAI